jgi:hypothetical protein
VVPLPNPPNNPPKPPKGFAVIVSTLPSGYAHQSPC